jgi:hypothetical protein
VHFQESGSIIVDFTLSPVGQIEFLDHADISDANESKRLLEGAEQLLRDVHFDQKTGWKRELTARVVFQLRECKQTPPSPGIDYSYDVCAQIPCRS